MTGELVPKRFIDFVVTKSVFDARLCHGIRSCAIHKFYREKAARLANVVEVQNG